MRLYVTKTVRLVRRWACLILISSPAGAPGADSPAPPGLTHIDWETAAAMSPAEAELVAALKGPMLAAMDVEPALQCWFDGRAAAARQEPEKAAAAWQKGLNTLGDLKPLPPPEWDANPDGTLEILRTFRYRGTEGVTCAVVTWRVDGLRQYGILLVPQTQNPEPRFPLLLYLHGAAFGVPLHAVPWLAGIARSGYAVIGPALRGEDLFATYEPLPPQLQLKCEGEIENLDGEVNDALSAVAGARKLPTVRPGPFGIIAHSFGAGVGLLVTARSSDVACMVSYDAWLTNPFRYYWDRMRRGANNWLSWAAYCNQPVREQLRGLMKRSIVHNAARIQCPLLLFVGGAYAGSVFHLSHEDLLAQLRRHGKPFRYDVVPDGGHNFVLYYDSEPARYAYEKHMAFLAEHLPPAPVTATDATRTGAPGEPEPALPAGTAPPGAATP